MPFLKIKAEKASVTFKRMIEKIAVCIINISNRVTKNQLQFINQVQTLHNSKIFPCPHPSSPTGSLLHSPKGTILPFQKQVNQRKGRTTRAWLTFVK